MQIQRLTKVIYKQKQENETMELNPENFQKLLTEQDPLLEGFFEELTNALVAKKSIVGFCYLLAGLRNKFANSIKLDIGLYLVSSGTSSIAINTLSNAGICANYKTIANHKKKLANIHSGSINNYFKLNVCIIYKLLIIHIYFCQILIYL